MDVKSPENRTRGGFITIPSIGIGLWIALASGPEWYWNALLAAIVFILSTLVLPFLGYQSYKLIRAELNKPIRKFRYISIMSLYSWALMISFGLIGRGIKSVFTWLTI